ncbi:MAG: NAD(P)/FAD-dependent oxidoreductase [Spirochaetia bacterium]|nr:NAD(P)/FAD-dependent oxidoreductase [Spirochaetia bacterium]
MENKHYEYIIVGSGLSGLTAAAYLSKAGYSVLVLEKTPSLGGLLNSFTRDGYLFDAGARSIENSGIIRPMLKDLGIEMELLTSPVSIGVESEIIRITSKESIDTYRQSLETLYPDDVADVRKIFKVIDKVFKEMHVIYGFENPVFKNFRQDKQYLFKELLPWLGKFLLAISRMERMDEPVETYLRRISKNQSLNDIIDQHFFKRTPTFFALGYFYVYLDYLYPKGGTGKFPEKLAEKILENSGKILVNTEIKTVYPAQNLVQDSNGQGYTYDKLLWCADLKALYRNLDTTGLESDVVASITAQSEKILASRGGDSVFSLFLGVNKPPQAFADIGSGHLFYTPSRKGLGETHLSELTKLLSKGKENPDKEEILSWVTTYCTLTTYEVSIPSLRDASLAPEGKTGLVVSFLLEYDLLKLVSDAGWYDEFKLCVEDGMIGTLNRSLFPGLLDEVELRFSSSPLSIEKRFGSSEGGITGWTFERPSPVVDRLKKIPDSVKTPIPDVLQCGQWAYSPAGIPTAILTGWYAADSIRTSREKTKKGKA